MTDLKHYRPQTLVENWVEDRAPPLANRVLPDYGDRRYTTDSRDAFPAPAPPKALQASDPKTAAARLELAVHGSKASGAPLGRAGLYSMTRLDNWESSERTSADATSASSIRAFGTTKVDNVSSMTSQWRTTQQACFGVGDSRDTVASSKATMRRSDAPWVVGRSGPRPEVGRGTSGCLGEVYKTVENPQMNTAVQRSWLYYKDPMLCYKDGEAVPEPIQPPQVCSLPGIGDSASAPPPFNPEANNKRVAKLTRYTDPKMHPLPGSRVFADEEEAVAPSLG